MYDEDGKDDISVLKGVLPLMSRHATGYHPISYAVWYEYSKGTNAALKKDVEAELQFQERLTAAQTYAIYVKHLVDPAERAVLSARTGLLDLVEDVKDTVDDADKRTAGFGTQLNKFEQGLGAAQNFADLKGPVSTMLVETRRTSEGFSRINQHLESSRGEVQRLTEELRSVRQEAQTDSLSGLLNRRGFDLELERLLPKDGRKTALALIMIDIDNFKVVNDTYGHSLGDAVIAAVGQFIRDCVASNGAAARYGGEEFAVLLPNLTLPAAEKFAESIRARVEQGKIKRRKDDEPIGGITISAGIAIWNPGEDGAALVDRADVALYAAKHGGRNRVVVDRPAGAA